MLSRRDLVGKLAAGAAVLGVAGIARSGFAATRPAPIAAGTNPTLGQAPLAAAPEAAPAAEPAPSIPEVDSGPPETLSVPAPWDMLRPLTVGSKIAGGWHLAGLTGVVAGSCVVTLQNSRGRTQRIHICGNDGSPQGLVYTKSFDLVVMNGGQGDLPTEEGFAQAVAEVAHVLARNEGSWTQTTGTGSLLPHAARVEQFADSARLR